MLEKKSVQAKHKRQVKYRVYLAKSYVSTFNFIDRRDESDGELDFQRVFVVIIVCKQCFVDLES